MSTTGVAVLVDLDLCVGCYACQSACTAYNKLPLGSTYLRTLNTKPERVDGRLQMFMCPIPLSLNHCAQCVEGGREAPCTSICIGGALTIGPAEEVTLKAQQNPRNTCLFQ